MKKRRLSCFVLVFWLAVAPALRAQTAVGVHSYNHIALPVRELTISLPFYRTILGLPGVAVPGALAGTQAWFNIGSGQQLRLVEKQTDPSTLRTNGLLVALHVASLRQTEQQLRQRNATFTRQTAANGAPALQLTDPDGYLIELTESKPATKPGFVPTAAKWLWKQVTTVE